MSREERIQYLEEERILLWKELTELKTQLEKRTPDYEADAKLASEQAIEFKNTSEAAKNLIVEKSEEINTYVDGIKSSYESVVENEAHTTVLSS